MKLNHFSEIIGQEKALSLLQNGLEKNRINHAYLFLGPEGVGKMLTARTFAWQLLACADKDAHVFWRDGLHPDLMIVEIPEKKTVITKEQITDEMEPWLALKPYRTRHRVVLIRDSHLISDEAANALLKTLEEPPPYAVIVLVADQDSLLETIISRCQIVRFFQVADKTLENYLLASGVSPKLAGDVSRLAQGSVALAKRFLTEENLIDKWQDARDMVRNLSSDDIGQVFAVAENLERAFDLYINMLETILRDILVYKTTENKDLIIFPENVELAQEINIKENNQLQDTINYINELKGYYRRHINPKLISINIAKNIWQALH